MSLHSTKKVVGIIPARYASTRLPGKPLAMIENKTMIEWTYSNSKKSKFLNEVIVATDDERIEKEVLKFGGKVLMTDKNHESGTDRIIEVAGKIEADIIVNIQGDEPGIEPTLIDGVTELKIQNPQWEMTSAGIQIKDPSEYNDSNRVKVVFDHNKRALYFSRSLIPSQFKEETKVYRHLGIYAYEKNFLLQYNSLPKSDLEKSESLEQLRAVQSGYSIGIFIAENAALSIDSPEDLEKARAYFQKFVIGA
ncbi:MAG: 3-deoxy-manno-octulosonate cytidylyltransferase [Leptospiraceae bacterium]|nr:3-deoxy-manno-octulosonate cytidylyltransferase [Leptospiraceae bacterium]